MAKTPFSDFLQNYAFWLFDVAPIDAISFPVLTPLFGFSSITAPEITIETQNIPEGNYFYTRKTFKRANVSNIVLSRGSTWYDSDFWRWIKATMEGDTTLTNAGGGGLAGGLFRSQLGGPTPRRTLVLVHFFAGSPTGTSGGGAVLGVAATAGIAGLVGGLSTTNTNQSALAGAAFAAGTVGAGATLGAALGGKIGPFEFAARLPAKAYILAGCLPIRYKTGSGFDAKSSDISIQELEISVDVLEELSLFA